MRKNLAFLSILAMVLAVSTNVSMADEDKKQLPETVKKPPIERKLPKLYDKDGNELKTPPKHGDKVYDKNGNEIKMPKKRKHFGPDLNLTEEQKIQADKIRENSIKKIKPIRKEAHELQYKIWKIEDNDTLTEDQKFEKVKPYIAKMQSLRDKENEIRKEDMKAFKSLLNAEQIKKLDEFEARKKEFKKNYHKKMMQ